MSPSLVVKMKLKIEELKKLIKEEQEKRSSSYLLAKPPTLSDIEKMVSEVLEEMISKDEE